MLKASQNRTKRAPFVRFPPGSLLTQLRNRLSLRRLSRISEAVAAVT